MKFQSPRGTEDVLPSDSYRWVHLETTFRSIASQFGYLEVRTPTFEDTNVFLRTAGDTSEVVTKQMYTFVDKGDRSITLKPEGTAGVVRALIQGNLIQQGKVLRASYITPIFRYERPQKGRLREAHQFGMECMGTRSVRADAEIIIATHAFYEAIGIKSTVVKVNSLGQEECQSRYRQVLIDFAMPLLSEGTPEALEAAKKNPLRLLDSKDPAMIDALAKAPSILDYLEPESKERFDELQRLLTGADVPFEIDPKIVRGLDYYSETVFEVQSTLLGSQSALCGGGRYDGLAKDLGGPVTPSVGVGMGVERALIVLEELGVELPRLAEPIYVGAMVDGGIDAAEEVARALRRAGRSALLDFEPRKAPKLIARAEEAGAQWLVLIGEDELASGSAAIRNLQSREQVVVRREEVAQWFVHSSR
jgi:histidyl-tRNA synthetase